MIMKFEEAVEFIENTPKFVNNGGRNKSGNDNLRAIMKLLDNPQDKQTSVHVAGTNGKGSTVRFAMSILCCMGYKVGTFISPHLERINERISVSVLSVNDRCMDTILTEDITDDEFTEAFNDVMVAVEENVAAGGSYLSYFEMLFAIAAVYFSKQEIDYVIYETGLGGRLDATNIIKPSVTAITSIGLDHMMYLGNTIKEIAGEKAGIIKQGIPVVYNTGDAEADAVIEARAAELNCEAINVAKSNYIANEFSDKTIDFSFGNRYYSYHDIVLNVCGAAYQVDNAATAITLVHTLTHNKVLPEEIVKKAMKLFSWPGRMERIDEHIIVDGAHNEDAINRFAEAVNILSKGDRVTLLFAVSADKDYEPMIRHLSEELNLEKVYVTSLNTDRAIDAAMVSKLFERYRKHETAIISDNDIKSALIAGYRDVKVHNRILFCVGSLYLVGSVKEIAKEIFSND